jgi:hypothetical protein
MVEGVGRSFGSLVQVSNAHPHDGLRRVSYSAKQPADSRGSAQKVFDSRR